MPGGISPEQLRALTAATSQVERSSAPSSSAVRAVPSEATMPSSELGVGQARSLSPAEIGLSAVMGALTLGQYSYGQMRARGTEFERTREAIRTSLNQAVSEGNIEYLSNPEVQKLANKYGFDKEQMANGIALAQSAIMAARGRELLAKATAGAEVGEDVGALVRGVRDRPLAERSPEELALTVPAAAEARVGMERIGAERETAAARIEAERAEGAANRATRLEAARIRAAGGAAAGKTTPEERALRAFEKEFSAHQTALDKLSTQINKPEKYLRTPEEALSLSSRANDRTRRAILAGIRSGGITNHNEALEFFIKNTYVPKTTSRGPGFWRTIEQKLVPLESLAGSQDPEDRTAVATYRAQFESLIRSLQATPSEPSTPAE